MCPTILTPLPSLRGQCKLILLCIKRREMSLPPFSSHTISSYPSICLYLRPSISLIPRFLASNDIYAILIGYLLYMRMHPPLLFWAELYTSSYIFLSLPCPVTVAWNCGRPRVCLQPIPAVACVAVNLGAGHWWSTRVHVYGSVRSLIKFSATSCNISIEFLLVFPCHYVIKINLELDNNKRNEQKQSFGIESWIIWIFTENCTFIFNENLRILHWFLIFISTTNK